MKMKYLCIIYKKKMIMINIMYYIYYIKVDYLCYVEYYWFDDICGTENTNSINIYIFKIFLTYNLDNICNINRYTSLFAENN